MYIALLAAMLLPAAVLFYSGIARARPRRIVAGAVLGAAVAALFGSLGFWGEKLWFDALGYSDRFWTLWLARGGSTAAAALLGFAVVFGLTATVPAERKHARLIARLLAPLAGAAWGYAHWDTILVFLNRVSTEIKDPILHRDTGFYLFALPFYDALYDLLVLLMLIALVPSITYLIPFRQWERPGSDEDLPGIRRTLPNGMHRSLYRSAAGLLLVLAWGKYLDRFHLLTNSWGVVTGAGWTDVHIRLPAYWAVAALTALAGIALLIPPLRSRVLGALKRLEILPGKREVALVGCAAGLTFGTWLLLLFAAPGLVQWLRVVPNEISLEKPYIAHNIRFTRHAFGLDRVEEKEFPVTGQFDQRLIDANPKLFDNVRLWDWRALEDLSKALDSISNPRIERGK